MRKTKIICTIGPATEEKEMIKKLVLSGANLFRINLSHASHEFCDEVIKTIKKIERELNTNIGIMLDLTGPSLRISNLNGGKVYLNKDKEIRIYNYEVLGTSSQISFNHPEIVDYLRLKDKIILSDGKIELEVIKKEKNSIVAKILNEGYVYSNKAVHVSNTSYQIPFISDKDKDDIIYAISKNIDFLALSNVRTHEDVLEVIDLLISLKNDHINLIAKIETEEAFDDIDSILKLCDGVMVARGDLGLEMPIEKLPYVQKQVLKKALSNYKVGIVATDMLTSMEKSNMPTRAEVSDVYNAVIDGADAVMLCNETTVGAYPLETLEMMGKIIESAEEDYDYIRNLDEIMSTEKQDITTTISYAVVNSALRLRTKAIVASTNSGYTAKKISRFRPICPIIATSPNLDTVRSLTLNYGVYPYLVEKEKTTDDIVKVCKKKVEETLNLDYGDKYIITGGFPASINNTNFMRIEEKN